MRRCLGALAIAAAAFVIAAPGASARTRPTAVVTRDPVLLVHGFNGSDASWHAMTAYLRGQGYRADEIDAMSYDSEASNVDTARQIAREVTDLRTRTGAARVDIVSHSMGAISSRYYVERLGGSASVDAWVSLAGVNEGTVWAYGCYALPSCREMVPSSSILGRLNAAFRATGPTRYGAWWSPCDEAIIPRDNAALTGAHNVETACLGHSELKTDSTVLAQVGHFLGERPAGS